MAAVNLDMTALATDVDEYRIALRAWLVDHGDDLGASQAIDRRQHIAHGLTLTNTLWSAGWKRVGWPAELGGLGGGPRHRATYYDELCRAGIEIPDTDLSIEVIGPAMLHFAPEVAAAYLPRLLAGEEAWAQAFSEPEAGSDLASLRTRGTIQGDDVIVDGQKVWTSHGHLAARLLTLVRTGSAESRHRGITALLVDTDAPGLTRRPLIYASGIDEMCETFFDTVRVPMERMIGAPNQGWSVAMLMLQFERGMYAAQRQAWLGLRLRRLVAQLDTAGMGEVTEAAVGVAWLQLQTVRARAIETVGRLHAGAIVGPEASPDKVLLARAEQSIFEVARIAQSSSFVFDDAGEEWRAGWWYSRATSIFGGAGEIQRSIIADKVLRLPKDMPKENGSAQ
jgi:alkylation response protein AidB-like acyl-CoA dehydrogenase